MTTPNKNEIEIILEKILYPDASSMLERSSQPVIRSGNIGFIVDISGLTREAGEKGQQEAQEKLKKLYPNSNVSIVLTSARTGNSRADSLRADNQRTDSVNVGSTRAEKDRMHGQNNQKQHADIRKLHSIGNKDSTLKIHLDGVDKLIAITAGKGGVGKSTLTALLAYKLKKMGKKVGILDADIYGPSIPLIFSVNKKPDLDEKKMVPLEANGIKLNSIGFITAPNAAISWRGPMTSKALFQLLSLTKWGKLDYLLIDMPPGTGDIHISLLENYSIDAIYVVTTPQKIAQIDVARSVNLYKKFHVPIAGLIENMSYLVDQNTGNKIEVFARNSAKEIAMDSDLEIAAQVPIIPALSKAIDEGQPLDEFTDYIDIKLP